MTDTVVADEDARRSGPPPADRRVVLAKVVAGVVVLALLVSIPWSFPPFRVDQFSLALVLAVAAMGLNLLTGYNGQISLGHGAFYAIGAFTTAVVVADHGLPHLVGTGAAAIVAFAVGVVIGVPALRIKGLYLAVVTLALAVTVPKVLNRYTESTNVPRFRAPDWSGLKDDQWRFYVVLVFAVVIFWLVRNLVKSRVGRALVADRDNEVAAEVLGVDLARYKVMTFGLSAALAGLAGSLSTYLTGNNFVSTDSYPVTFSIELLVAVVIGGVGTLIGPVLGAFVLQFLPELSSGYAEELSPVVFGGLLIFLMIVMPGGLVGFVRKMQRWFTDRKASGGSRQADPRDEASTERGSG